VQGDRDALIKQVSDEYRNEFGEVDMGLMAETNPALAKVLNQANFRVVEMTDRMDTMQSSALGLTDLGAMAGGAPVGAGAAPELPPAERALRDAGVMPRKEQRALDIAAQKEKETNRARQVSLTAREAVIEGPDGTLVATNDPVHIKHAAEQGKKLGRKMLWPGKGDVPGNWIGESAEDYRNQNERGFPPAKNAGATGLGALGRFGGGGPGGF